MAQSDLESLINSTPPSASSGRLPIGVPKGHLATPPPRRSTGRAVGDVEFTQPVVRLNERGEVEAVGLPPVYFDGDEWLPTALSVENVARLQKRMVETGLIPKGAKFRLGVWDDVSRAAYTDLLAFANAAGLGEKDAIPLRALERWERGTPSEEELEVPPLRLRGPAEIAQAVKGTVKNLLGGREPTPEELDELADVLTGFTRRSAEQERSAAVAASEGTGGEFTVEDPMARFSEFMETKYRPEIERLETVGEVEEGRHNLLRNVLALDSLIAGGA